MESDCKSMHLVLNSLQQIKCAKRKTKLLRTFGSIKRMKEASVEDLKNSGLPQNVAENLHLLFVIVTLIK
jgi:hypothetical protein